MKRTRFLLIISLLLPAATAVRAQADTQPEPPVVFNIRDSLMTILSDETVDGKTRHLNAYNMLWFNAPVEELEQLALEVMYPFVCAEWADDDEQRLTWINDIYILISFKYKEEGNIDKECYYNEKGLEVALESGKDVHIGYMYHICGLSELKRGDAPKAHEYLYEAVKYYDKAGRYARASEMLYLIGFSFIEIKDAEGLARVIGQAAEYLKKDDSEQSQYQYNTMKHAYFDLLLERDKEQKKEADYALVDSALVYIRANLALIENSYEKLAYHWSRGKEYYALANKLNDYYPDRNDEIFDALDKAVEIEERDMKRPEIALLGDTEARNKEVQIMLNTVRMKAFFRTGRIREAQSTLNETLELLSELDYLEYLNVYRSSVYEFAAGFYQKTGDLSEAIRFLRLYAEIEAGLYEKEKIKAINDMSAKYETEKKQIRIETLTRENRTARQILWLVVGLALAAVAVGGMVIVWGRLRRRNIEQRLYETALLAELRQEEIEKMQLPEQTPVADTIEKIARQVAASAIDKNTKSLYLDNLSHLDGVVLENAYRNSEARLTALDIKYIICFNAGMSVPDIGTVFSIEPASVNTVRYRIRKKFAPNDPFRTII